MAELRSRKEAQALGEKTYFTGKPCRRGHVAERYTKTPVCLECIKAWSGEYWKANKERINLVHKKYNEKNKDRLREYREQNKQRLRQLYLEWTKANPKRVIAYCTKRRADQLQRIPAWADLERIAEIYEKCPPGHHVDHIIPLRGKLVSGLHVETNLQYLPASENMRKGNRVSLEEIERAFSI